MLGLASTLMTWYGELDKLLNFLGLGLTVLGLIFGTSIFLLRRRSDYQPTFRVPFYPLPPVLYLLSCVFIMTMSFISDWEQAAKAVAVVLIGAPIYWAAASRWELDGAFKPTDVRSWAWVATTRPKPYRRRLGM